MSHLTCGFIGLGLIGGSIARALKKADPDIEIVAYDVNRDSLRLAEEEKIADIAAGGIDDSFRRCDYLFLCAPVQVNDNNLETVKKVIPDHCLLTDVGSVKTTIHEAIRRSGLDERFIGGHPMAGSERVGFASSKASLLENAYYILTPTSLVPSERVEAFRQLVVKMGAIPLILDFRQHDYVTAAISHLPHVVASSLVSLIQDSDSQEGTMRMVAAGGFKDITRIASSSPAMWQQICLTNRDNISVLLGKYIRALTEFKETIDAGDADALYRRFDSARKYRDSFANASSGPIKSSCSINVEIADRAGSLAHIVTLLADRNLNIKNIAISHNRESEDGVLRVEFYEERSMAESAELLKANGYAVHIRG